MINIAIDGTAGSGKGTISKLLAKKLGYYHLDTGAIYRSLTYFLIQEKVDLNDEKEICKTLEKIDFKVQFEKDK
ncbi:MAG: (d)CMP kinase, partial [Firmicutes bacterium]|nr:(d)CMP kinase [Bacillota bacterium]